MSDPGVLQAEQSLPADGLQHIKIMFRDSNDNEVTFKLKSSTKLGKAFDAFSARVQREPKQLRFLFDGNRLAEDDTIQSAGIEEGDTIEVHMEQLGGADEPQPQPLTLTFRDLQGDEIAIKLKHTTKFGKACESYASRFRARASDFRFVYDGDKLTANETPGKYEASDGDVVDVFVEQIGGSGPVTQNLDHDWVLVTSEDDESYIKRLEKDNIKLQARLKDLGEYDPEATMDMSTTDTDHSMTLFCKDIFKQDVTFKLKRTTRLGKAFEFFAERVGVPVEKMSFHWHGQVLDGHLSPSAYGMMDSDTFTVVR